MKAYEKLIPENSSPSYFLYLDVETDRVDVNVSPHKTEVRFADADDLYQIITSAIRSTLAKSGSIGMMDFDNKVAIDIPVLGGGATVYQEPKTSSGRAYNPFEAGYADGAADPNMTVDMSMYDVPYFDDGGKAGEQITSIPSPKATAVRGLKDVSWSQMPFNNEFALGAEPVELEDEEQYEEFSSSLITGEDDESSLEFVPSSIGLQQSFEEPAALEFGDVYSPGNGYAFATSGGRMMVVDLRRAKERILYDGYIAALSCGAASSQQLLFPEELTLSLSDYSLLEEFAEEFAALGFDLQLQGEGRVQVCGVPSSIVGQSADCLLYELLREAEQRGNMAEKMREDMARVMAVSGSRNIGHNITGEAATQLLQQLCECENYSFTPSGKAIMAELTAEELRTKLS